MFVRSLIIALAALLGPAAGAAQSQDTVAGDRSARTEIERILNADNLDSARLSPREVAQTIAAIERGRAPDDFWTAYRLHVQAWERFADAVELAQRQQSESTYFFDSEALRTAQGAITTTFDEVERIARRYGARLPSPPVDIGTIA